MNIRPMSLGFAAVISASLFGCLADDHQTATVEEDLAAPGGVAGGNNPCLPGGADDPCLPTTRTYTQLYTGPDGNTHFRDLTISLAVISRPPAQPTAQSAP